MIKGYSRCWDEFIECFSTEISNRSFYTHRPTTSTCQSRLLLHNFRRIYSLNDDMPRHTVIPKEIGRSPIIVMIEHYLNTATYALIIDALDDEHCCAWRPQPAMRRARRRSSRGLMRRFAISASKPIFWYNFDDIFTQALLSSSHNSAYTHWSRHIDFVHTEEISDGRKQAEDTSRATAFHFRHFHWDWLRYLQAMLCQREPRVSTAKFGNIYDATLSHLSGPTRRSYRIYKWCAT